MADSVTMIDSTIWMGRSALFELLSKGLLRPQRATAEALASGEFAEAAAEVSGLLGLSEGVRAEVASQLGCYRGRGAEEVLHEIRCGYTELFGGVPVPRVTPYLGVRDAERRGKKGILCVSREAEAIEHFMKRCGVAKDLAAGQANDPVDHIGTVCEFLMFLCLLNAGAVRPAEGARVEAGDFDAFVAEHFASYAAWCADQIPQVTESPFYHAMAALLAEASCWGIGELCG